MRYESFLFLYFILFANGLDCTTPQALIRKGRVSTRILSQTDVSPVVPRSVSPQNIGSSSGCTRKIAKSALVGAGITPASLSPKKPILTGRSVSPLPSSYDSDGSDTGSLCVVFESVSVSSYERKREKQMIDLRETILGRPEKIFPARPSRSRTTSSDSIGGSSSNIAFQCYSRPLSRMSRTSLSRHSDGTMESESDCISTADSESYGGRICGISINKEMRLVSKMRNLIPKEKNRISLSDIVPEDFTRSLPVESILKKFLKCPDPHQGCKFSRNDQTLSIKLTHSLIRTVSGEFYVITPVILGAGKFSITKLCIKVGTNEKFVLKVSPIFGDSVLEVQYRRMNFENEKEVSSALGRLKDAFISIDPKSDVEKAYLIIPYYEGVHLDELDMQSRTIEEIEKVRDNYDAKITELYELGYMHRDLHEENVLVNPANDFEVNLIDFGIISRDVSDRFFSCFRSDHMRTFEKALEFKEMGIDFTLENCLKK